MPRTWYTVDNLDDIPSPALLVYPERVEENVARMVRLCGGPGRLRPHVKTHKLPQVVALQLDAGITKFKAATIAEAEMTASAGAPDVLLAYQPAGPNVERLIALMRLFPRTRFSALADDEAAIRVLAAAATGAGVTVDLYLDLDCGMHRTGVAAGPDAAARYRQIATSPGVRACGFHVYDGHIHDTDIIARSGACAAAFGPVRALRDELTRAGLPVPVIVAGGTPTFPLHARQPDVDCSPGTTLFWDWGYTTTLPDMDFLPAALLLTRVVSKPGGNRLCLDLGHKAVASENPPPRVQLFGLEDAVAIGHSEEHLVVETSHAPAIAVGAPFYGMPWHICPTVALHAEAVVVREGVTAERWPIAARARHLTV